MKYDFIIIGSGIVGLTLGFKLKKKHANSKILILDKERDSIQHGSGRNSGVIHSGIYYNPGSLRATLGVKGGIELKEYIKSKKLWIDECGKILLPTSKKSCSSLELLLERAEKNSIYAKKVHSEEILHLEPNANPVFGEGIFIPFTSVVNPKEVAISIMEDIKDLGVEVVYNSEVTNINSKKGIVECGKSNFFGDILVNSAGLQADNISKLSGYKTDYSFLPFKGKYWEVNNNLKMSKLLYPIPNLDLPFLGIHSVHNKLGDIYLGPSSTPVFGRENYNGIKGLSVKEAFFLLLSFVTKIVFNTNGLRSLAFREIKLFSLKGVLAEAKNLMTGIEKSHFKLSNTKLGIRSQIFDKKNRTLVSDFVIEKDKKVIHILNAISPAFTASFGLADYIIENIINENN